MTSAAMRRVLVVEDESMVAMLLEDMLTELGHSVVGPVSKAGQAASLITKDTVDFAVLDVNINGGDTYSVAEMLKERRVPFVFATGYGKAGLKPEWRDSAVLSKPFQADELRRAISEALP